MELVGYKKPFPDSCVDGAITIDGAVKDYVVPKTKTGPENAADCTGENGGGLSWDFKLAPGETTTRSHYTTFSPYGNTETSISDAAMVTEPAAGTTAPSFEVKLVHPAGRPVTLHYTTGDGSAKAGSDYQPTTGRLTIPAGKTSGFITVPVWADDEFESIEDFKVQISDRDKGVVDDPPVKNLGRPVGMCSPPIAMTPASMSTTALTRSPNWLSAIAWIRLRATRLFGAPQVEKWHLCLAPVTA